MEKIIIYTTKDCQFCKMAKAYFKGSGVSFTDKDIEDDPQARAEMMSKSGQFGVPVIDINGRILVGFNLRLLSRVLGDNSLAINK